MGSSRKIFVTGFPGFIAGRLVERLAAPDREFFLLVQEQFLEKAREDAKKIAGSASVPIESFRFFKGDITKSGLGLSEENLELLRNETTDAFHLAALYDLAVERDPAFSVNVDGTRNVNDVVRQMKNLYRYNYVSTCYVAGKREGRILETELEHEEGFRNFYEETKYLAEVEAERLKAEVPTTIYRPSVVCGDSRTGETAKYDGIYYVIKFLLKFPEVFRLVNVGNKDVRLNLVPVDFVIDGMAALWRDPDAAGKTVALADPDPMTTKEICDLIAESVTNKRSVITPPAKMVETILRSPFSPPITGLPHSGVPYFFVPQEYDTAVAESLLTPHGVECPRFGDYVGTLVSYVEKHPSI